MSLVDLRAAKTRVTVETERIFHYISDEELEMLPGNLRSVMGTVFGMALGAVLGATPGAVQALDRFGATQPLLAADLAALAVALACGPVALLAAALWWRDSRQVKSMQARIRARHKVPVESAVVLDHPA